MPWFNHPVPFVLESGQELPQLRVAYETYGSPGPDKEVVWVCHALTGHAQVADWWSGLFGKGKVLDPERQFIICANVLGSCYGTTGPLSYAPHLGRSYYLDFPFITVRDMVAAHVLLRKSLGIAQIDLLIGGSLGGQQVLEWALLEPEVVRQQVLVATNARHSAWGVAFNTLQQQSILDDLQWPYHAHSARRGLKRARALAMLSYRSPEDFAQKHEGFWEQGARKVDTYLEYQGDKFLSRFDAFSYLYLAEAMSRHDIGRGRGALEAVLNQIKVRTLCIGISSDVLFPLQEQEFMARQIPRANLQVIHSTIGHDAFLVETERINAHIENFRKEENCYENR